MKRPGGAALCVPASTPQVDEQSLDGFESEQALGGIKVGAGGNADSEQSLQRTQAALEDVIREWAPIKAAHDFALARAARDRELQRQWELSMRAHWIPLCRKRAKRLHEFATEVGREHALVQQHESEHKASEELHTWMGRLHLQLTDNDDCKGGTSIVRTVIGRNGALYSLKVSAFEFADDFEREVQHLKLASGVHGVVQLAWIEGTWGVFAHGNQTLAAALHHVHGVSLAQAAADEAWARTSCETCAISLLLAVRELHSRGLIHGDIKPTNVILHADLANVTVVDLGHSALSHSGLSHAYGTPGWRAPEVQSPAPGEFLPAWISEAQDIWAVAVAVICFVTGKDVVTVSDINQDAYMAMLARSCCHSDGRAYIYAKNIRRTLLTGVKSQAVPSEGARVWFVILEALRYAPHMRKTMQALYEMATSPNVDIFTPIPHTSTAYCKWNPGQAW